MKVRLLCVMLWLPVLLLVSCGTTNRANIQTGIPSTQYTSLYSIPESSVGLICADNTGCWFKDSNIGQEMLEANYSSDLYFGVFDDNLNLNRLELRTIDMEWKPQAITVDNEYVWIGFYKAENQSILDGQQIEYGQAVLVKIDKTGEVMVTIELNKYAEPVISVLGTGRLQKKSELAQEYIEAGLAHPVNDNCFPIGDMECDDLGNLYVTGFCQDLLVFSPEGNLIAEIECYDSEYDYVTLVKCHSGQVCVINSVEPDDELRVASVNTQQYFRMVDLENKLLINKIETSFFTTNAALASPLEDYEIIEWNDTGIYGFELSYVQPEEKPDLITKWSDIEINPKWLFPNGYSAQNNNPVLQYRIEENYYIIEILLYECF